MTTKHAALTALLALGSAQAAYAAPPEPLLTRYADTQQATSVSFDARYFEDMLLQEVENFTGYTLSTGLVHPLGERTQLRLDLPFYTNGEADFIAQPLEFDIEGHGGVFEFPSLSLDWQWLAEGDGADFNLALTAGVGSVIDPLDAELNGSLTDRYNHSGIQLIFGLRADRRIRNDSITLAGNFTARYYQSDDVNPAGPDSDDSFTLLDLNGAMIFPAFNGGWHPAVEAQFESTAESGYTQFALAPELLIAAQDSLDLRLGAPIRVSGDGERYSLRLGLTWRFD
jgi:hypothetical protein